MKDGVLGPLAFCTDDHVGIWYEGTEPTTVVADLDADPATGPAAYRTELVNGEINEIRVPVGERFR
jgi:hypothetical protein